MVEKRFLVPVKRRWKLLILPILAILYFAAVLLLAAFGYEVQGVTMEQLVLGGAVFFALVLLIELPYVFKRKVRAEPEVVDEPVEEPVETFAPMEDFSEPEPVARPKANDELLVTSEVVKDLRVLEYSAPSKSRHSGAVYAKTMVPVTKEHILRVENLAAEDYEL